jgi:hypothetical protein
MTNITSFLSVRNGVLHLFKKDDSMGDSVYNSLLIIMLVSCTGVPVLAWLDTPKFLQYLQKWEEFQVGRNLKFVEFGVKRIKYCDLSYFSSIKHSIRKKKNIYLIWSLLLNCPKMSKFNV